MTPYREQGQTLAEPAPYLDQFDDCPHCGACPAMLYFHDRWCPWWVVYIAAGKRMRKAINSKKPGDARREMTESEWKAVIDLAPPKPKPHRWVKVVAMLKYLAGVLGMIVFGFQTWRMALVVHRHWGHDWSDVIMGTVMMMLQLTFVILSAYIMMPVRVKR